MTAHAAKLIQAAQAARREVVLIAPFIKTEPLAALFAEIQPTVSAVTVVARWIPIEIAAGVCDLGIYDVVCARAGAKLFVHPLLHAKLYRFDHVAYFGSANITRKALGLAAPSNVEILLSPAESLNDLKATEAHLLQTSIQVDNAYRDAMAEQVASLGTQQLSLQAVLAAETHEIPTTWLPSCAAPDRLWNVYADINTWRIGGGCGRGSPVRSGCPAPATRSDG